MQKKYLYIIVIFLLSSIVYLNTLRNGFVYDDKDLILNNSQVKEASLGKIFSTPFWGERKFGLWRPITVLSFRLDYLVDKFSPFIFHFTNIMFHSLVALTLYFFFLLLTDKENLSFFSSLIYAVHPIHTEAVSWIAGRSEILSALFFLLSFILLILFHKGEDKNFVYLILSGLFFLFSLLSKETGVTLPLIYSFYLVAFQRKKLKYLKTWTGLIYLLFLLIIYIHLRIKVLGGIIGPVGRAEYFYQYPHLTPLFTSPLLFFKYLKLSLFPFHLSVDYTFAPITHASTLFLFLSFFFLLYIFLIFFTFKHYILISFSLAFFPISLLPFLHIVPIGWLMGERFLYLPTIGISLLIGILLTKINSRWEYALLLIILISFSAKTYMRNFAWKDEFTLWKITAEDNPNSVRAYYNLATFFKEKGKFKKALNFYSIAHKNTKGRKEKSYADIYNNWGIILGEEGKFKRAEELLRKALEINPFLSTAYINLGNIFIDKGRLDEGIDYYKKAIVINPNEPMVYKNISWAYLKKNDLEKSEKFAKKFLKFKARSSYRVEVLNYLFTIYFLRGKIKESEKYLKRAIEEKPDFPLSYLNYGNILMKEKKFKEAEKMYLASLHYGGPEGVLYRNMGILNFRKGDMKKSKIYFKKAVFKNPRNFLPYYYLGMIFEKEGKENKAKEMWRKSLLFNPPLSVKKNIKGKFRKK